MAPKGAAVGLGCFLLALSTALASAGRVPALDLIRSVDSNSDLVKVAFYSESL